MQAAFLHGTLDVRVEQVPTPQIVRPDDVLIEVAYSGICGSELHVIEGYQLAKGDRRFQSQPRTPLGHEYAGVIREVGPDVKALCVGQPVTAEPRGPCGMCDLCRNGSAALCRKVTPRGGAWADLITVPQSLVHSLPDDVPLRIAAITEPLSCAVRIVDRAEIRPGINACVIGAGAIGLFSAVLAKHAGAAKVIVSETRASRREMVRRMGVDIVVDPTREDLYEVVMQQTKGRGVEASIEAVGFEATLSQAIKVVAPGGTVVWGGVAPTDVRVPISPNDMFMREYTLRTSWGGILEYERTLRLEQAIDWTPVVQEVYPLERVMDAVTFARTEAGGKVLLQM